VKKGSKMVSVGSMWRTKAILYAWCVGSRMRRLSPILTGEVFCVVGLNDDENIAVVLACGVKKEVRVFDVSLDAEKIC
jgi:hypothetical protein